MTAAGSSREARRRGTGSPAQSGSPAPSVPGGEPVERAEWAVGYLPLVRGLAKRFRRRSSAVDVEDLVSAGTVGLMEALERYDPGRGVPLGSFAYHRIRGAIIDELRRQIRPSAARGPATEEVSLDAPVDAGDESVRLLDVTADATSPQPTVHAELAELVDAVGRLPARERQMLTLHTRGFTLAEIARRHGCSIARASTVVARARLRLQETTIG